MAESYARSVLVCAAAQICQNLGWHAVHSSPIEILVDILDRYLKTIARTTHNVSEHYNRTQPNFDDLGLAFKELGISLSELEEYVNNVEPVPFAHVVPKFPFEQSSRFHFPKEGSREVQQRPEWIGEHLPLMYPEVEDEESRAASPLPNSECKPTTNDIPMEHGSPHSSPWPSNRRPLEITQETNFSTPKRPRLNSDEETRLLREVTSVTMTAAGLISPMTEGRLPDTCTPSKGFDSRPPTPAPMSPCSHVPSIPSPLPLPSDEEMTTAVKEKESIVVKTTKLGKGNRDGKKVKKDNKENKKKKELKASGSSEKKNRTKKVKLPGVKLPKKKDSPKKDSSGKSSSMKSPKTPSVKSKSPRTKAEKVIDDDDELFDPSRSPAKQVKKSAKSPKGAKLKVKSPKGEKQVAGGQLASLLAKASGNKFEKGVETTKSSSQSLASPRNEKHDWLEISPVGDDSCELIDDIQDIKPQKLSHSSVGNVAKKPTNKHDSERDNNDYDGIPSIPSRMKLEPRDVYDFTDEDDGGNGEEDETENDNAVEKHSESTCPLKTASPSKKVDEEKTKSKDSKKLKSKVKNIGDKKSKIKSKSKSSKHQLKDELDDLSDYEMPPPKTPQYDDEDEDDPEPPERTGRPSSLPFHSLSQIPSALLPFPLPAYPGPSGTVMTPNTSAVSPRAQVPYPKLVDLAEVAISKAKHDGDFDVVGKYKDRDSREKDKKKREKREKEKAKSKKKKDKSKDKLSLDKSGAISDKDRSKIKKEKAAKLKSKDRKEEKSKDRREEKKKRDKIKDEKRIKDKKPDRKKLKEKSSKKDKLEKPKEEPAARTSSPSVTSAIPRLTFKLGNTSEANKIVFKHVSVDSHPSRSPPVQPSKSKSKLIELPPERSSPPPPPPRQIIETPSPIPESPPESPVPTSVALSQGSSGKSHPKPQSKVHPVPAPARTVITETVGTIIDASGNKIWICPACTHPDDGSPMIGCDECDEWYHWVCVNIVVPPKEEEEWFCTRCIAKKQSAQKRKKHRRDK